MVGIHDLAIPRNIILQGHANHEQGNQHFFQFVLVMFFTRFGQNKTSASLGCCVPSMTGDQEAD
jgi:hypothetical protein